jgi:hypothetical protein
VTLAAHQDAWGEQDRHPLANLNARLLEETGRFRAAGHDPEAAFRGLYIEDQEVDGLLAAVETAADRPTSTSSTLRDRLAALAERFGLSPFDMKALLVCVAPDIDLRYERIYAYLQDDVNRKRPTVDLVLRLLSPMLAQRLDTRPRFSLEAPLRRHGLVTLRGGGYDTNAPLLARPLEADERVVAYLTGSDAPDPSLRPFVTVLPLASPDADADDHARLAGQAADLAAGLASLGHPTAAVLVGETGSGKRLLAAETCRHLGLGLIVVETARLLQADAPPAAVRAVFREAALQGTGIYWSGADRLWSEGDRGAAARAAVLDELLDSRALVLLGGPIGWEAPATVAGSGLLRVDLPIPDLPERLRLWRDALAAVSAPVPARVDKSLPGLAAGFRLTSGQIRDALAHARGLAASRDATAGDHPSPAELYAGSRAVSGRGLAALCRELRPRVGWRDIVLHDDTVAQLQEICSTVRHRGRVLEDWGFAVRLSGGTGTTALFAGPSGTGKTMAAEVIAGEIGVALFRIDLAGVVSKWIGETEKNLDRLFRAAENSNAILFFDEADALFGKRSEVRDSHDRYANIEISYLLQKMEAYDGVAILATNMRQQLDEAFLRRLSFSVIFSFPEEDERLRIWKAVWPRELPRAQDVDLAVLSRFKLTGGNIRNIVLAAAYLAAASKSRRVTMAHLRHAVRREYQKLGKEIAPETPPGDGAT